MIDTKDVLYRKVADRIQSMIDDGMYGAGEKVPSLRALSASLSVSVNTVREAYLLLESRGVLEARPQAGFYVSMPVEPPRHPRAADPVPTVVTVPDIVHQVMRDSVNSDYVSLALALTDQNLLPLADVERALVHALRYRPHESLGYQFKGYTRNLRTHLARRLMAVGVDASAEDLVVTAGCMEAVSLALLATCNRGDTVAVESPTYFIFFRLIERMGLQVVEIPADPETGMQIDVLEYVLDTHSVKAVLSTANFHNPTGSLMSDEKKARLVSLVSAAGAALIEDDIYGELHFAARRPAPLASFDTDGTVIHCSSVSKTVSAGLRIGWVRGGRWADDIERLKATFSITSPAPSVQALTEYLDSGRYDRHLRKLRRALYDNMCRLVRYVRGAFPEGTRLTNPAGGMTTWVELPADIDTVDLYGRAREKGISVAIGPMFTMSRDFHQFLRLNAGLFGPEQERALDIVGALCREALDGMG